jgi:hypothetical protein
MLICKKIFVNTCGAICLFFGANLANSQVIAIPNPGFEESDGAGWAKGWERLQHAGEPAYRFTLDEVKPFSGKFAGKIEQIAPQVFGLFKQRVNARAYAGKRVSIRVQAKAQGVGEGGGGLYVRIDGISDTILASDFDSGKTQGTHGWKPFRAVVEIPANAVLLEFGIMLQDNGTMWADDFTLELTTDPITKKPEEVKPDAITFDSIYKNRSDDENRMGGKVRTQKP